MSKNGKKYHLNDECLENVSGGYYHRGGLWKPWVVTDKKNKDHYTWTKKGAKKLEKEIYGCSEESTEAGYWMNKAILDRFKDQLFEEEDD